MEQISFHADLLFNAFIAGISAIVNMYYVLKHSNGKKGIRLISVGVMVYFTATQLMAATGIIPYFEFGAEYLRPWMPVLFLIPVFDVIIDFKGKSKSSSKGD